MHDPQTLLTARLKANAFTRKRGMSFPEAQSFMLDMRKTTLQTRLNIFPGFMNKKPISQQSFSELRMNFDHSPFETMVRGLVAKEYSGEYELPLWNGLHLLAVDGSYLQLPRVDALRTEFGVAGSGACPCAGISVLYDLLHGWPLDPIITHYGMNERAECGKHLDFIDRELSHIKENSVLLLDRGYPSFDLIERMQTIGIKYVVRCYDNFLTEVNDAPMGSSVVLLKNKFSARVFKFALPSGEIEILVTNLFDLPNCQLAELYGMRWDIETAYFRLKRQLCVEKFSGKTPNSIRQDFWASMVLMIIVAVFQAEADREVERRQFGKRIKHENHARTSHIIISLRDRFIFATLCGDNFISQRELDDLIPILARVTSPVRPGRSFDRKPKPYLVVNHNLKSHL